MQEGSVPGYQDRAPLFPGGSCYPLSGEGGSVKTDERLDQLNVIFGVIGTPDPEDIESIGTVRFTVDVSIAWTFCTIVLTPRLVAIDALRNFRPTSLSRRWASKSASRSTSYFLRRIPTPSIF